MANTNEKTSSILIADDDHVLRAVAAMALQSCGYDVGEATNGREALSLIDTLTFDLALVDLDMPEVDGFQVIEDVRSGSRAPHLPIIVVTGRDDVIAIERAFALGATSFVTKPLDWNILTHHIRYILQSSKTESEVRASKQAAESQSALKGNLLSVITHEFRTPLNAIHGFSSLIESQGPENRNNDEIYEYTQHVKSAAMRLNVMLSDAMLLSRGLAKDLKLKEGSFMLDDMLTKSRSEIREKPAAERIFIKTGLSQAQGVRLKCDRDMFCRAITCLLDNAVIFSDVGTKITIDAHLSMQGDLICAISNQGSGMSAGEIEKAMELFSQLDMTYSRSAEGLGLGLTVSKLIAGAHGGRLEIASIPGQTTTASFIFPASRIESYIRTDNENADSIQKIIPVSPDYPLQSMELKSVLSA